MLPFAENYRVYPMIVPADTPVPVTIVPAERAFLFEEGEEIQIKIISLNEDEPNFGAPSVFELKTVCAKKGCLAFEHAFPGEQEHKLILFRGQTKLWELSMYSLKSDLYALRPLKGDLHMHSYRSDGRRDPAALAGHYREQGFEFISLTDHNRYYPGAEIEDAYKDVSLNLTRIPGEELHPPETNLHIVHVGGQKSVAEVYVHDMQRYLDETARYLPFVPEDVPDGLRRRYAAAMWSTDNVHEAGGIAIFPHPFWKPGGSGMYHIKSDHARILLKSGMFDAYEVVGGMQQPENNLSVALYNEILREGEKIPAVGSSDVHLIEDQKHFAALFTLVFARENTPEAILEAIRCGLCAACEAEGPENTRTYRVTASFRLCAYSHFLLKHYYPRLTRIAQAEGVLMRLYAMGDADADALETACRQSEDFQKRLFGKLPPVLPTKDILDFEEKWRREQRKGPLTKGSSIVAPPVTMQI